MTKNNTKLLIAAMTLPLSLAIAGCNPVEPAAESIDEQPDAAVDDSSNPCLHPATGEELHCEPNQECIVRGDSAPVCECKEGYFGDACEYSHEAVLEEFVGLPDPSTWSEDPASGTMYRLATAHEREVNNWLPGTFLVEASGKPEGMELKRPLVELVIPMTPQTTRPLNMVFWGTDSGRSFIESRADGSADGLVSTTVPIFNLYASQAYGDDGSADLDGAVALAISVDGQFLTMGSLEREGLNGTRVDRFRIIGHDSAWIIDPIPAAVAAPTEMLALSWSPNPQEMGLVDENPLDLCSFPIPNGEDPLSPNMNHPCNEKGGGGGGGGGGPEPVHQCNNIGDDDGDGKIDDDGYAGGQGVFPIDDMCLHQDSCSPANGYPYHDHTKESGLDYGLFGSVLWCTHNKETWKADMYARALFSNGVFHASSIGNAAYNDFIAATNSRLMRWTTSKCWMLNTVEQAEDCKSSASNCGPFSPGSQHEYPYGGLKNPRHNFSAYQYASKADLAHAATLPSPLKRMESPLDLWQVIVWESQNDQTWGGTASIAEPASIINGAQSSLNIPNPYKSSPHEFGHVLGCDHCDTEYVDKVSEGFYGQEQGWSIMVTSGENEACSKGQNSGDRSFRFSETCSLKMINSVLGSNDFNHRQINGPSFGW